MTDNPFEQYLTEEAYAEARGISVRTAQRERKLRTGPAFTLIGKKIFYRKEAIATWLASQEVAPPAQPRR